MDGLLSRMVGACQRLRARTSPCLTTPSLSGRVWSGCAGVCQHFAHCILSYSVAVLAGGYLCAVVFSGRVCFED